MTIRVLDPTSETRGADRNPATRPASLDGAIVGSISNGKEGTVGFFSHLDRLLRERFDVAEVVHRTKANYSAPAEQDIIDEARNWLQSLDQWFPMPALWSISIGSLPSANQGF